jgi:hypothetical protein
MTYYQVEFSAGTSQRREPKRFRTEEKAKKHAMKVLGVANVSGLQSLATILPVSSSRSPLA